MTWCAFDAARNGVMDSQQLTMDQRQCWYKSRQQASARPCVFKLKGLVDYIVEKIRNVGLITDKNIHALRTTQTANDLIQICLDHVAGHRLLIFDPLELEIGLYKRHKKARVDNVRQTEL